MCEFLEAISLIWVDYDLFNSQIKFVKDGVPWL